MVEARRHMFISGTSLDTLTRVQYPDFAGLYGGPWLLAHRVDLHSELRRVATDPNGLGKPVDIVLRAEVVDYNTENGSITLANGLKHHADLIVAADGVHSSALRHVTGQETPVMATGWAVFRFLLAVEELRSDPDIAPLLEDGATKIEDGLMKIFSVEGHMRRLVWYPCAE